LRLPVTLLYGGLSALLLTLLGVSVSLPRLTRKLYVGADLPKWLHMRVRAHGNAAEWIPVGIVLLLILELSGTNPTLLHVFGGVFLLARVIHALGFLGVRRISVIGATINYCVLSAMSGYAVVEHFLR